MKSKSKAVKPKTKKSAKSDKTFNLRIPQNLYNKFKEKCDKQGLPVANAIKHFMENDYPIPDELQMLLYAKKLLIDQKGKGYYGDTRISDDLIYAIDEKMAELESVECPTRMEHIDPETVKKHLEWYKEAAPLQFAWQLILNMLSATSYRDVTLIVLNKGLSVRVNELLNPPKPLYYDRNGKAIEIGKMAVGTNLWYNGVPTIVGKVEGFGGQHGTVVEMVNIRPASSQCQTVAAVYCKAEDVIMMPELDNPVKA